MWHLLSVLGCLATAMLLALRAPGLQDPTDILADRNSLVVPAVWFWYVGGGVLIWMLIGYVYLELEPQYRAAVWWAILWMSLALALLGAGFILLGDPVNKGWWAVALTTATWALSALAQWIVSTRICIPVNIYIYLVFVVPVSLVTSISSALSYLMWGFVWPPSSVTLAAVFYGVGQLGFGVITEIWSRSPEYALGATIVSAAFYQGEVTGGETLRNVIGVAAFTHALIFVTLVVIQTNQPDWGLTRLCAKKDDSEKSSGEDPPARPVPIATSVVTAAWSRGMTSAQLRVPYVQVEK